MLFKISLFLGGKKGEDDDDIPKKKKKKIKYKKNPTHNKMDNDCFLILHVIYTHCQNCFRS